LRILLVDDHALFREGLKLLLREFTELNPDLAISEASDCAHAAALHGEAFDLILLDLHMPGVAGLDALTAVRASFESSRIVVLSGEEDPRQIRRAIESGAAGFVPKSSSPRALRHALTLILDNEIYLPPIALREFGEAQPAPEAPAPSHEQLSKLLTDRQIEVLNQAVEGKANKVIARGLGISEGTVKAHLSSAFRALGVRNRTEAVYRYAARGPGRE